MEKVPGWKGFLPANTCSKSPLKGLNKGVKYVQS